MDCFQCVHTGFTILFLGGKKKQVAAGHWPSPDQGEHLKSRARYNTAELSDFNEKSGPAGLVFLGHILSAIPQEIIQPSPTAKKQMVYWRKKKQKKNKYSEVYVLVKSKFKHTKAKDDTNTESTFSPEKWTFRDFHFSLPF